MNINVKFGIDSLAFIVVDGKIREGIINRITIVMNGQETKISYSIRVGQSGISRPEYKLYASKDELLYDWLDLYGITSQEILLDTLEDNNGN